MAPKFEELLKHMDMALDAEACPGLVPVSETSLAEKKLSGAPAEEVFALERALHFGANYVYFRRFVERPVMATVYVYDWTERLLDTHKAADRLPEALRDELVELQRRCWSAGEVPLVYVFLPTRVHIYHVLKGPRKDRGELAPDPWQDIELGADVADALAELKAFSARRLDSGRFWEEHPGARELELSGAAFMALSREIENCRKRMRDKHGDVPDALVKRLLIVFVLVKYLEERGVFPEGIFGEFDPGAKAFVDLLRAGGAVVATFLDHLADKDRWNGEVFALEVGERNQLQSASLGPFADLLDARIENEQRTFWRRYAFDELPVELISHLYEQFLPNQPGVVYTPPFLVSFILDEVLPLSEKTPDSFRLIDPACGSGVFLVGAFKRLVYRWRTHNDYRRPTVDTLKEILRKHVFGVDCEGEAIQLSMFSLSLALCDFLEPRIIWGELHFDRLKGRNLIEGDFFAQRRKKRWNERNGFDLVVGNPPFKSTELTESARDDIAEIREDEADFELPDKQAALLFLKVATRIARPGARIALIQPSGPFLYNEGSSKFRRPFLEKVHVPQIVDLTHLSRVLFKRPRGHRSDKEMRGAANPGDVAVAVVFAENRPSADVPLLHVTVRRTVQAEQKLLFEIDHYDLHFIPRQEAIHNRLVWKANFIGGGRVHHLLGRLEALQSLRSFLEKAKRERGWVMGEGYIVGDEEEIRRLEDLLAAKASQELTATEREELAALRAKYKEADWLTGKVALPTEAFTASGIDWDQAYEVPERFFIRPRREALFSGPLLLIKDVAEAATGKLPVALLEEGVRFKDRIYGVHAPASDMADLRRIFDAIGDDALVQFYLMATSGELLVNKSSALHTADILNLPFPNSAAEVRLSSLEEALIEDALEHVAEFKRKGEEALVLQEPTDEQLGMFGEFFCRVLGSVYRGLRPLEPVRLSGGISYPFCFGKRPSEALGKGATRARNLEGLLSADVGTSLRCRRILRVFRGNMLLLVKPPQLRYWLRSIAIRDADEIFAELQGMGY